MEYIQFDEDFDLQKFLEDFEGFIKIRSENGYIVFNNREEFLEWRRNHD